MEKKKTRKKRESEKVSSALFVKWLSNLSCIHHGPLLTHWSKWYEVPWQGASSWLAKGLRGGASAWRLTARMGRLHGWRLQQHHTGSSRLVKGRRCSGVGAQRPSRAAVIAHHASMRGRSSPLEIGGPVGRGGLTIGRLSELTSRSMWGAIWWSMVARGRG